MVAIALFTPCEHVEDQAAKVHGYRRFLVEMVTHEHTQDLELPSHVSRYLYPISAGCVGLGHACLNQGHSSQACGSPR